MQTNYDALNSATQAKPPASIATPAKEVVGRVQPQQTARRHTRLRAALLGAAIACSGCTATLPTRPTFSSQPVARTCFDHLFARIGHPGQSPCLDFAGANFIAMREAGQRVRFVIGRWTGRGGELLHAWVEDERGGIVDFHGMGGPERYRPLASWDGEQRCWHLDGRR
jgi:hypothetical protein